MNISTNYSNTNQSYKHLSEAERGEIEAYLSVGLKPAEIARRLGRNRSNITREINPGSVKQVKQEIKLIYLRMFYYIVIKAAFILLPNTTIYVKKKAISAVCPVRGLPQIMRQSKASILR